MGATRKTKALTCFNGDRKKVEEPARNRKRLRRVGDLARDKNGSNAVAATDAPRAGRSGRNDASDRRRAATDASEGGRAAADASDEGEAAADASDEGRTAADASDRRRTAADASDGRRTAAKMKPRGGQPQFEAATEELDDGMNASDYMADLLDIDNDREERSAEEEECEDETSEDDAEQVQLPGDEDEADESEDLQTISIRRAFSNPDRPKSTHAANANNSAPATADPGRPKQTVVRRRLSDNNTEKQVCFMLCSVLIVTNIRS